MTETSLTRTAVLVVDDEPFSQRLVARVLEKLGVGAVATAANGAEALDILRRGEPPVDIVISDIEMPEMDGFELARMIRYGAAPQYKDIPILMLTGQDTEENIQKGRIHRIQGFIIKPPKVEVLKTYLETALGLR